LLPSTAEACLEAASVRRVQFVSCSSFLAYFRKQLGRVINGRKAESWGRVRSQGGNFTSNRSPGKGEKMKAFLQLGDKNSAFEAGVSYFQTT
jgi:hypothetical protein